MNSESKKEPMSFFGDKRSVNKGITQLTNWFDFKWIFPLSHFYAKTCDNVLKSVKFMVNV